MVQIPRILNPGLISGAICLAHLLPTMAVAQGDEAADRLWQSFLQTYQEYALKALSPAELDEKARAALIGSAGPKFRSWKADANPTLLAMASAMVEQDPSVSKFTRIEKTLEALLPAIDTYGHYHLASDVAQLQEALRQNPGSVHMTLDRASDGRIVCFPLDGGPADKAGIGSGATLLAVDGRPAEGKSLPALRLAFVGPPNSPIKLKVTQPHGKVEEFTVNRTDKPSPNVVVEKTPLGLNVRIRKFDKGSASAVKQQLEQYPDVSRLTLDLRGNAGGVRDEALRIASLFFPQGTPLGTFTTNTGAQTANDGNGVTISPSSIRILQDGRTASAAEFLIATLHEGLPDKVTLFGKKTYGKSHSTVQVALDGGGEVAITEALLSTPGGRSWDKTGIVPDQADKE